MSLIPRSDGGRKSYFLDSLSLDDWDDSFSDSPFPCTWASSWIMSSGRETFPFVCPPMNWKETPEAHVCTVDIPGVKEEELKVGIKKDDRLLQISGERMEKLELNGDLVERSCGKFTKRCWLPEDAKVDRVKASIKNGVLKITVPKVDRKESDIEIIEITA